MQNTSSFALDCNDCHSVIATRSEIQGGAFRACGESQQSAEQTLSIYFMIRTASSSQIVFLVSIFLGHIFCLQCCQSIQNFQERTCTICGEQSRSILFENLVSGSIQIQLLEYLHLVYVLAAEFLSLRECALMHRNATIFFLGHSARFNSLSIFTLTD